MHSIWMAIRPTPDGSRLLAMQPPHDTILQARLRPSPSHPRALPYLMEAIALWQGARVHAALYADESGLGCATSFFPDRFTEPDDTPLYALEWLPAGRPARRRRSALTGARDFRDLQQLLFKQATR
jgi:hypothetical protein